MHDEKTGSLHVGQLDGQSERNRAPVEKTSWRDVSSDMSVSIQL